MIAAVDAVPCSCASVHNFIKRYYCSEYSVTVQAIVGMSGSVTLEKYHPTYQTLGPTVLKKKKMERKGKGFGRGFADLT